MNAARALLGIHVPGTTVWHRLSTGPKYVVFLLVTVPAMLVDGAAVVLGLLAVSLALVASTRAPIRLAWGLPSGLVVLLALLGGYHALTGHAEVGVRVVGTILTALYASRLLLITTPMPDLIDALVGFVRPLRHVGLDPERFGLAVAIMVRSVPHLVASFGDVQQAARARGLERNPLALITPVVVQAVAYARSTGDALAARGLGDRATAEPH